MVGEILRDLCREVVRKLAFSFTHEMAPKHEERVRVTASVRFCRLGDSLIVKVAVPLQIVPHMLDRIRLHDKWR